MYDSFVDDRLVHIARLKALACCTYHSKYPVVFIAAAPLVFVASKKQGQDPKTEPSVGKIVCEGHICLGTFLALSME